MVNYEKRVVMLKSGFYDRYKKARSINYKREVLGLNVKGESLSELYLYCKKALDKDSNTNEDFFECTKLYESQRGKNKRLNKRIKAMMLSGECVFLTLTFKPEVLESTTAETRRTYARKSLEALKCDFVANVDFGKKNEREHYHALVRHDKLSEEELASLWSYGFSSQRVAKYYGKDEDGIRLARYINKLSNHARKESTKGIKLIYSRNKTKIESAKIETT